MTLPDLVDRLAAHKALGVAPRQELEWLASHGSLRQVEQGVVLSKRGERVENLFVLLKGHVAIFADRGAGRRKAYEWRAGDVAGTLPYSRLVGSPGETVVLEPSEILAIPSADFPAMIRDCPEITSILVHKMLDRARDFTSGGLQDERMVSLGKLSAGLVHELNNPVSAIERSAALLHTRLEDAEQAAHALGTARLSDSQSAAIDALRETCLAQAVPRRASPIQQAEREDAITGWLGDHGVGTDIAGSLSETAVTIDALDRLALSVSGPPLGAVLRFLAAAFSARGIASEIQEAAKRISGLVTAIKGFTHMDRARVAEAVDLEPSLGHTVTLLKGKARAKSVALGVNIEPDLPHVRGVGGELNQIWMNLIDNALDAAPGSGRVEVTAGRERERVVVRVVDNGPGVPDEIRGRIFEPFFTTKPVGKGTGLGLDIVRRLVSDNDAEIEFDSVPGRTEFRVSLRLAEVAGAAGPL